MTAVCFLLLAPRLGAASEEVSTEPVSFAYEVRPILSDKCYLCHGPDEEARQADLRLDTLEGVEYVFAKGDIDQSPGWDRIHAEDEYLVMPPPELNKPLSAEEKATIDRWMRQGAPWADHWSFNLPQAVEPPPREGWGSTPIDAFIHKRLREADLAPAQRASKEILIRRLSFDLTGLPPTLEEIDAFVLSDDPQAYEQLVDRLLASPRYGERFASIWLDAARYSDTFGYQRDEDRFVWPWRDWVIRALNSNQPYDKFLRDQLAGDLIEEPTQATRLATTFSRLHGQNSEGGSIPEEFRMEYVADRAQTVSSAMLGLTMECCRCHDHKYDPLSIEDYYAFTAFFDKIDEAGLKSYFTQDAPPPTLSLPTDREQAQLADAQAALRRAEEELAQVAEQQREAFESAAAMTKVSKIEAPKSVAIESFEAGDPPTKVVVNDPNRRVEGVRGSAVLFSGDDQIEAIPDAAFERNEPFSVSIWIRVEKAYQRAVIFHASQAALDSASRGYELLIEDDHLSAALVHYWPGNAIRVVTLASVPHNRWVHVALTYDGSSTAEGLRIYLDGKPAQRRVVRDKLTRSLRQEKIDALAVGARFRDSGLAGGALDELSLYDRELTALEVAALALPESVVPPDSFDLDARFEHYLHTQSAPYATALAKLQARRQQLVEIQNDVRVIMAMEDDPDAPPSHVRRRGAYDQLGEEVQPAPPEVLPPLPEGAKANRLALAEWLVRRDNPLTARVAVNRLWQAIFGAGLVRTPEDFGAQGVPPTHPYLLDYLATEFVASGWDQKALIKQLVMSDVYQQATSGSPESYASDPENKLHSRAPRRRWPAEMLRDNALAASGLLVNQLGGAPAKPYEVAASFKPIEPDTGTGLYRRSVYTYFKRSAPAPVLTAFDAPDRSVCRVQRERTQSPMQALVLLNGPQFVEAARVLASEAITTYGNDDEAIIVEVFRKLTSQRPTGKEVAVLKRLLKSQRKRFANRPEQARELLSVGAQPPSNEHDPRDVAATAVLAQTIMSCDKCVTKQ